MNAAITEVNLLFGAVECIRSISRHTCEKPWEVSAPSLPILRSEHEKSIRPYDRVAELATHPNVPYLCQPNDQVSETMDECIEDRLATAAGLTTAKLYLDKGTDI